MPKSLSGYTLIELLVVITILGLLTVSSVVYYKSLTSDKVLLKGVDTIQSILRTAQSNATSGFDCPQVSGATAWFVQFRDDDRTKIDLYCVNPNPAAGQSGDQLIKTQTLENLQVDSIKGSGCTLTLNFSAPVKVSYAPLSGRTSFYSSSDTCIGDSSTLTITLKSVGSGSSKSFTISNGGAINVR